MNQQVDQLTGLEIAVIGMAGRFPGADGVEKLWTNLTEGVDSITLFSEQQLTEAGVSPETFNAPEYVAAAGLLPGSNDFDASFFGYAPQEVQLMDPQVRVLHEVAWETLENAGYDSQRYCGDIGVYAGANADPWWVGRLLPYMETPLKEFEMRSLCDTPIFCTRLSYKLDLRGPSLTLQSACSTSLVAIHLAVQSLLCGECDMALAGGVTIAGRESYGYRYQDGMILSADGHTHSFDADATGTLFTDGAGMVLLKRFEDAEEDNDTIHAVIKGSAVNNDGNRKVSYTAPSIEGQASVIRSAYSMAGIDPTSIGYLEAHGTATPIGDPIEISALKAAFNTEKKGYCRIGSIKSNVGHLNSAAGISGFIKAVLILKHRLIPPTLHFKSPNPGIDFENSPFVVNTENYPWPESTSPRRAGVTSIGGGGTNAHVILEEAPPAGNSIDSPSRSYQLVMLSAKTPAALDTASHNLSLYLRQTPDTPASLLADAAYTLMVGRQQFRHRRFLVTDSPVSAADSLYEHHCSQHPEKVPGSQTAVDSPTLHLPKVYSETAEETNQPLIFMFPGVGAQYVQMAAGLYREEPFFREQMDHCFTIMENQTDYPLKSILYPTEDEPGPENGELSIDHPVIAQLTIFMVEYSLARLIMHWGLQPEAVIGYSFGEYTAACIAGVFSLESALQLVLTRARLILETPPGAMLSVPAPVETIQHLVPTGVSIAIDNGEAVIVSGTVDAIDDFHREMKAHKFLCMKVDQNRALHSPVMDPILDAFAARLEQTPLNPPQIPLISNVLGRKVSGPEVTERRYWVNHLRERVRFAEGIAEAVKIPDCIFIEVGPGRDLGALVKRHIPGNTGKRVFNLLRHPNQEASDTAYLQERIGRLWANGVQLDGDAFYSGQNRKRIPLPTYPFERKCFRPPNTPSIEQIRPKEKANEKKESSRWFYLPTWQQTALLPSPDFQRHKEDGWLILADQWGIGEPLATALEQKGQQVTTVIPGTTFLQQTENRFVLNPSSKEDYRKLMGVIADSRPLPRRVLHCWSIRREAEAPANREQMAKALENGFYSFLYLVQAIRESYNGSEVDVIALTDNMQAVSGEAYLNPAQSPIIGIVNSASQENLSMHCRSIDISLSPGDRHKERLLERIITESLLESGSRIMALRDNRRWLPTYEALPPIEAAAANPRLREGGVYLITGGLGGIGLAVAKYLTQQVKAKVILNGRSPFPPKHRWEDILADHPHQENVVKKIHALKEIEAAGGEVLTISADVADEDAMLSALTQAEDTLGPINGVFHAAGIV
ncbi:MAG: acyltransferase domain-containing protein, partial [bacterium]|nr:acyltransferase domain-containing protein [bacterium]